MINRIFSAVALAIVASSAHAAQWTSFNVGKLNPAASYSANTFTVRPDGRFLYSEANDLYSQNSFGSAAKTKINRGSVSFDPAFIAVRDATTALVGVGGFNTSGIHLFNPSTPSVAVSSTPLSSLQNYAAVWWQHPTSGRSGWVIEGTNAAGKNNLTFVSADGTRVGAITDALCDYSAGLATDAAGNVFIGLSQDFSGPNSAESDTVLKYTAAQIDAAVAGVIISLPAALAKSAASTVFKFDSAATIAVDSAGRIWAAGYLTNDLQVFDPNTSQSFRVTPPHATLAGATGSPTYQVATFTRSGANYVAFLANDANFTKNSDVVYGYALAEDLPVRQVSFASASQTVAENAGSLSITVNITPAPAKKVTVPITLATGTATKGSDFNLTTTSIVFNAGETSKQVSVQILNDGIDELDNNETIVLKLGTSSPATHASSASGTHTITITDDDVRPLFDPVQTFVTGRVGTFYSYQMAMVPLVSPLPVTYKASNLPTGLNIDPGNGTISGRATVPGEYDQVVITATNSAGVSVSRGFVITVEDYAAAAHGSFVGILDRGLYTSNLGGLIEFTTTATATFTGKLTIGKAAYPFSGVLGTSTGNAIGSATYKDGSVTRSINLIINASTGAVTGTLDGTTTFSAWPTLSSTPLAGLHTFGVTIAAGTTPATPEGTGFGSVTISSNGKASITGKAADGSAFTSSAQLGRAGELPLYQPLYVTAGSLLGKLSVGSDSERIVTGSLTWRKPSQTSPASQPYLSGWTPDLTLSIAGGKYRAVSGTTAVLGNVEGSGYDATLAFSGGGIEALTAALSVTTFIRPATIVSIPSPQKLSITNATAAFTGNYSFNTQTITFQGLLVPNTATPDPFDSNGLGYFLLGNRSGAVALNAIP